MTRCAVSGAAATETETETGATAVWGLCLVQFVDVLGVTEMVTALPSVLATFRASSAAASIVLTSYAACFAGVLMLGARLSDRYGPQRILGYGLAAFFVASLTAAAAPSVAVLVAGRGGQGVAAAISVPATLRLLNAIARDERERDRAFAAWSATGAVAGASGYLVGGGLTQALGWRWMFWVDLPAAAVLAAWVATLRVPVHGDPHRRLDLAGAGALTVTVLAVVLATASVQPPVDVALAIGAAAVAVASGLVLVAAERRAPQPLLAGPLRRDRRLRAGGRASFLNTATTSSAVVLATLHLQDAHHLSPARAGLQLMPISLGAIAGARLAPWLRRRRTRPAVISLGLATIAVADLALVVVSGSPAAISVAVGVAGIGLGASSVAATALAVDVAARDQATAGAAANTAAQLGTAVGVAVVLSLTGALTHGDPRAGWGLAAAVALLGAVRQSTCWMRTRLPAGSRNAQSRTP
jgi:MFS family permease